MKKVYRIKGPMRCRVRLDKVKIKAFLVCPVLLYGRRVAAVIFFACPGVMGIKLKTAMQLCAVQDGVAPGGSCEKSTSARQKKPCK